MINSSNELAQLLFTVPTFLQCNTNNLTLQNNNGVVRMNISLRNKVDTYQTFCPCHMDFFIGRVAWSHNLRVTSQELE